MWWRGNTHPGYKSWGSRRDKSLMFMRLMTGMIALGGRLVSGRPQLKSVWGPGSSCMGLRVYFLMLLPIKVGILKPLELADTVLSTGCRAPCHWMLSFSRWNEWCA